MPLARRRFGTEMLDHDGVRKIGDRDSREGHRPSSPPGAIYTDGPRPSCRTRHISDVSVAQILWDQHHCHLGL